MLGHMEPTNLKKWKGWWRSSMLLAIFLPMLSSHAELVNLTRGRMVHLARVIEQVYEQTGNYPHSLEAGALTECVDGLAAGACRDAWGRRLAYTFRNPEKRRKAGEYWLGSSCGKPFFGGFLRFMTGQLDVEGDDLVLRNGEFILVPPRTDDPGSRIA